MDCEQFDSIVMDLLYGELGDDNLAAAAKRHVEGCDRCASLLADLRSTRKASALALVAPPAEVLSVVLGAARQAQRQVPLVRRFGRWISWAGSYAMRPQLAMAALLMLMIGSSLLLIRGRPGSSHVGIVRVTEQGEPEREGADSPVARERAHLADEAVPLPPRHHPELRAGADRAVERRAPAKAEHEATRDGVQGESGGNHARRDQSPPARSGAVVPPTGDPNALQNSRNTQQRDAGNEPSALAAPDAYAEAMALFTARDFASAYRAFDAIAARGGPNAASAALHAAKAVRASSGCMTALPRFESIMSRFRRTGAAIEARWEAASCSRILGDLTRARIIYRELAAMQGQRERAEMELARISSQPVPPARAKSAQDADRKSQPPANRAGSQNSDSAD
jgi:hypothetical protein